jgi:hypothetical protein
MGNKQSRCPYRQHEVSMPGVWASGDVLLILVTQIFTSWNQMSSWLGQLQALQRVAIVKRAQFTNHFGLVGPALSSVRASRF